MINQLGCERFAQETGQKLTHFYSVDKWGQVPDPALKKKWGKSKKNKHSKHVSDEIDFDEQLQLWNLRHGATEHFPGKLSLCLGMPIMLRNNDATELCITKGQEGFVVGWQSYKGPHGKNILDTLFVKLDNPPQLVQIPGLPDNVVPIVKSGRTITCTFPNDMKESVTRQQVWALPNFGMTAHASQGKTRPYNVSHLNSCRSHMAYYTALSRSATAAGTIIIQGFDSSVIMKGCSGYLRQEFREQEILDDITRLRYEEQLPSSIIETLRNPLIRQYQELKGTDYVPEMTDGPLRWSSDDPLPLLVPVKYGLWQMLGKVKSDNEPKSIDSKPLQSAGDSSARGQKHKHQDDNNPKIVKKLKSSHVSVDNSPLGLKWDANNWSCAYDSLFVILYNIWKLKPDTWTRRFNAIQNEYLSDLIVGFDKVSKKEKSFELVRDEIKAKLNTFDAALFPTGRHGASVASLAIEMFKTDKILASSQLICSSCDYYDNAEIYNRRGYVLQPQVDQTGSTNKWILDLHERTSSVCPECSEKMEQPVSYYKAPRILLLEYPEQNIVTSHLITVKDHN
jgi:hypothetical protein